MKSEKWLDAAAYATWLVAGLPELLAIGAGDLTGWRAVVWVGAFLLFGALFTLCTRTPVAVRLADARSPQAARWSPAVLLLALESLAGLTMMALSDSGTVGATLVIVVAQAASVLPPAGAWAWLAAQTIASTILWSSGGWITAITVAGAFAGFQAFAVATMTLARSERAAREELMRAHAELSSTQSLLAESTRVAERLRISRDLHDALGHHLTALSLQLEVASRLTDGPAAKHVQQAHAITRLLLSDVRDVVGTLRQEGRVDLGSAIRALVSNTGVVEVHLEMPDALLVDDPEQAHALLRCVQEVITNAMRHAQARNLWITVDQRADGIALTARDDGRGVDAVAWGNGLRGMRERFEELSGRVDFSSRPGAGFEVQAFVPK